VVTVVWLSARSEAEAAFADAVLDSDAGVVELLLVVVVVVVTAGLPDIQAASTNVPCQFRIWTGTGVVVPLVCVVVVVVVVLVV